MAAMAVRHVRCPWHTALPHPYGVACTPHPHLTYTTTASSPLLLPTPNRYGFVTEVGYDTAKKAPFAKKWYTLGRVAVEMALVMPDQKTVSVCGGARRR